MYIFSSDTDSSLLRQHLADYPHHEGEPGGHVTDVHDAAGGNFLLTIRIMKVRSLLLNAFMNRYVKFTNLMSTFLIKRAKLNGFGTKGLRSSKGCKK
jgi:hypothetical protein